LISILKEIEQDRWIRISFLHCALLLLILASCSGGGEGVLWLGGMLVGNWDLVSFSDGGVTGEAQGTAVFRGDGMFSIVGTVTFPGEPTDSVSVSGRYELGLRSVELITEEGRTSYSLEFHGDDVVMTESEPPPANMIKLRRRQ